MKISDMKQLSDAELREISIQRVSKKKRGGKYTQDALRAQSILLGRSGRWQWVPCKAPSYEEQLIKERGDVSHERMD